MPLRYLLDTNICIYIAKHRPVEVLERFKRLRPGEAAISAITYGELQYGACKSRFRKAAHQILEQFTALVPVLAVDSDVSERYGEIRAALEKSGTMIGNNDLWIASHAAALGVPLVSNNEREFRRVPGLRVQNWIRKSNKEKENKDK